MIGEESNDDREEAVDVKAGAREGLSAPEIRGHMASFMSKLQSAFGEVTIPEPTRAALILSAKQWVTAIREEAVDVKAGAREGLSAPEIRGHMASFMSLCERVEKILAELAAMEEQ